ncbi:MAG: DUF2283 domain-containing protein [Algicola sp.]|nr:DUF2283 domain-containing protein [Algicola sp.]
MKAMKNIELKVSADDEDVAYLYLPGHPRKVEAGIVQKQVELRKVITQYSGPDVFLDFNNEGKLIGIEILA